MEEFFQQVPSIIEVAAKSRLGILALLVLATGVLGFLFFRRASSSTRLIVFFAFFFGAASFTVAVFLSSPEPPAAAEKGRLEPRRAGGPSAPCDAEDPPVECILEKE